MMTLRKPKSVIRGSELVQSKFRTSSNDFTKPTVRGQVKTAEADWDWQSGAGSYSHTTAISPSKASSPRARLFESSFHSLDSERSSIKQRLICKQRRPREEASCVYSFSRTLLVVIIVIVVVIVPIAVRTPAVLIFIPPSVIRGPAALPLVMQDVAPFGRLLTLIAVMLDGLVQIVIGFRDASLAVVISAQS